MDEAGVEDTLSYPWGWSPKGTRCLAEKLGHRTTRVSMAAGWCCGEIISPLTFEGYCDSALIETWFKLQFCGALRVGQTVIMDNASFHRKAQLTALLEQVDCFLLFVPPYSPDLNKIEPLWNQLKLKIMLDQREHPDFRTKVDAAFL